MLSPNLAACIYRISFDRLKLFLAAARSQNAVCLLKVSMRASTVPADSMQAASCRPLNGGQFPLEYAAHHGRVSLTKLLLQVPKCAVASGSFKCTSTGTGGSQRLWTEGRAFVVEEVASGIWSFCCWDGNADGLTVR